MSTKILALAAVAFGTTALSFGQAFTDTFDSINPAWVTDRYEPAGFSSVNFLGDNRLKIDISAADSYQNRTSGYQSTFYNTQGRQRAASNMSPWTVSGDLYISDDMLTGANLRRTDLWARDSNSVENNAKYPIFGVIRNDGTGDAFDPNGTLTTRWRVWDDDTSNGWVDLGDAVTGGWHNLAITSTGSSFEYRLDGNVVYTDNTYSASGFDALQTVFVEAYSFGDATHATTDNYSVYWDNISAGPVPEPASMTVLGLGALALIRRRRQAKK